jgi:hypothetical protein
MFQTDKNSQSRYALRMEAIVKSVDSVGGKVLVSFADGSAVLFDGDFLYSHRNDEQNQSLPAEPDES